ncbi:MAG: M24 family metallopeptidase [Acidobacteriota bacterium]|nr:M24 family metallopeptidase [Acidobacteriota bacterium]
MDLKAIQASLTRAGVDAWLFYDHHRRDPIAYRILQIAPSICTRRWYYIIPSGAEPEKLVHRIEAASLSSLPGIERKYASWPEQIRHLRAMLAGRKKVAMQYSPLNAIPYIGLVDAGTVELVRQCGAEVVSSEDLVQEFEARWTPAALALHLEAGQAVHEVVREAFNIIRVAIGSGKPADEYGLQQEMLRLFSQYGVESSEPPIVAVNAHSADPHYEPTPASSISIRAGDFVLLDVWAKRQVPGAVYFDITWTGFVGGETPRRHAEIFEVVRQARDTGVELVETALSFGRPVYGYEVDDAVRHVIARHGYGDLFIHRTGHSIGEEVHGNGANMDNFETHDSRRLIPGTCFSVEPGIYLKDFGVRSEVDVYVDDRSARITGEAQEAIVPILAAL